LTAAAEIAEQHSEDFSVIHVGVKDGVNNIRQFGGDKFANVIKDDIEIR